MTNIPKNQNRYLFIFPRSKLIHIFLPGFEFNSININLQNEMYHDLCFYCTNQISIYFLQFLCNIIFICVEITDEQTQ